MRINHVWISGYRNIKKTDFGINNKLILIGENNSGKSNVLKAITSPLSPGGEGYYTQPMTLRDVNDEEKNSYYKYIKENFDQLMKENSEVIAQTEFLSYIPKVKIRLQFDVDDDSRFYFEKLITEDTEGNIVYQLEFQYQIDDPTKLLDHLKNVKRIASNDDEELSRIQVNLLPEDLYKSHLIVPGKNDTVSYDLSKNLKYYSLIAERDGFSTSRSKMGSSAIIKLLNRNIDDQSKISIEQGYNTFFDEVKDSTKMDEVFNWAKYASNYKNAQEFFGEISILPNMPPMNSLLNSVQLGYAEEPLAQQGLGYRNLVYLSAMVNALERDDETPFAVLSIEEPEAHLSNENQKLLISFLNSSSESANNFQLMYSTHNTNFLPKLALENVVIMSEGKATSFKTEMNDEDLNYLIRNPNLDVYKLFFSTNVILVEGLSEELLIKSYLQSKKDSLNNIEVLSFHKGFCAIIRLWLKININNRRKLAVIRDFDNQPRAKGKIEKLARKNKISINTTNGYTLEDDIVKNNFEILRPFFKNHLDWPDDVCQDKQKLAKYWENASGAKGAAMAEISLAINTPELENFRLPEHIMQAINFFKDTTNENN